MPRGQARASIQSACFSRTMDSTTGRLWNDSIAVKSPIRGKKRSSLGDQQPRLKKADRWAICITERDDTQARSVIRRSSRGARHGSHPLRYSRALHQRAPFLTCRATSSRMAFTIGSATSPVRGPRLLVPRPLHTNSHQNNSLRRDPSTEGCWDQAGDNKAYPRQPLARRLSGASADATDDTLATSSHSA